MLPRMALVCCAMSAATGMLRVPAQRLMPSEQSFGTKSADTTVQYAKVGSSHVLRPIAQACAWETSHVEHRCEALRAELHRAVGFKFHTQHQLLSSFAAFADAHGDEFVRIERALDWASRSSSPIPTTQTPS